MMTRMPLKRDDDSTTPEQQSMLGIDLFCIQGTAKLILAPRHVPSQDPKEGLSCFLYIIFM
jgi:hypothetical protein